MTRTRIRILGSGSVKNSPKQKMQMIPDPDVVRIREWYQIECECIWIRILESGFRNFYADPRFASDPYHTVRTIRYGPPPPDLIGLELLLFLRVTRHLDHPWEAGNAMPCSRTMPSRSGKSQTRKYHVYHYHLTVNLPWTDPAWKGIYSSPACRFGVSSQDD